MRRPPSLATRLLLAAAACALAFVFGVGLIDLLTGHTFLRGDIGAGPRMAMTDEERVAAAARNTGSFAAAIDPHVGVVMSRGATRRIVDADVTLDPFGQRVRVGPPPADGAVRIVVLGDSVAFGYGLPDDQTIAHHLEDQLAVTMAPGRPRPVVHTIACPGWSQHNACRYLLDNLARLRPDVVVFVPVGNDLHDGYTVSESGHRSLEYDAVRGAGHPHTSAEQWSVLMYANYANASNAALMRVRAAGGVNKTLAHAVMTGLTPESKRRWAAAVAEIADLRDRLAANRGRLALAFPVYEEYSNLFHAQVGGALPDLPLVFGCERLDAGDRQPNDPHPSSRYARMLAWCIARSLLGQGWIDGADPARLPPCSSLPGDYAERLITPPTLEAARARAAAQARVWTDFFESEIVLRTTQGFHQVYGAVHGDGTVNRTLWLALANPGGERRRIRLEIDRLARDSGVYPLHLEVSVNGTACGRIPVPAPDAGAAPGFATGFEVPPLHAGERFLDIRVEASNWIVEKHEGTSRITSFRLVRIGFE